MGLGFLKNVKSAQIFHVYSSLRDKREAPGNRHGTGFPGALSKGAKPEFHCSFGHAHAAALHFFLPPFLPEFLFKKIVDYQHQQPKEDGGNDQDGIQCPFD